MSDDRRCESYTAKGTRCKRKGTCWSTFNGRHCRPHMRKLEPRNIFWML